jgi:hypothetical protein
MKLGAVVPASDGVLSPSTPERASGNDGLRKSKVFMVSEDG